MQRRKSPSLTANTTSMIVLKQEAACVSQPWLITFAGVKENIVHWPYVRLVTPSREPIGKAVSSTVCSQKPEAGSHRRQALATRKKTQFQTRKIDMLMATRSRGMEQSLGFRMSTE